MKSADYRCTICENIRAIDVKDTDDFPKIIPCFLCNEVTAKRVYSPIPSIVHQGSVGNAKSGYTSTGGNVKKS